ncbi:hypothetical protein FF38_08311 [Lucilia cuprina]|uniref:Uncharacterized protein n=1 Tax=Lucilia cuprina TaxID=7375 RepID=A0A0L0CP77_LUCCU|nr:hypothetical protein CVS40_3347 [Lucilia cuprina]KAI8126533.1 hypothetical protein CVS40_3347 [Lucilia cuprina]KNC34140.1 hypothetical protein FF38_08311 [Lucilia cuprina]
MNFNHSSTISSTTNFISEYSIAPNDETCGDSSYNCTFSRPSRHDIRMMAGLKIFAFILMRVWCKGRKEIKQLKQSIEDLKDICMRSENQMRVYSALMRVEQSRNSELTAQLKRTLNNLKRKTASYEITAIKLSNLKANKVLLEHELKNRYEEYEALHEVLSQTKTELFRSMMEQRNLQMELCKSQRSVQSLEIEKNGLIMQICNLKKEHRSIEEQLNVNDNKLIEVKDSVEECQPKLIDTQKNYIFNDFTNPRIVSEELPNLYVTEGQNSAVSQPLRRLAMYWARFLKYPKYTLRCVHVLTWYLLPAMPPPSTKFT